MRGAHLVSEDVPALNCMIDELVEEADAATCRLTELKLRELAARASRLRDGAAKRGEAFETPVSLRLFTAEDRATIAALAFQRTMLDTVGRERGCELAFQAADSLACGR